MKYITEYRDKELRPKSLVADIAKEARPDRNYRLMEFCGGLRMSQSIRLGRHFA